jgi:oligopeptide/dipeptide ABC transporter ATP-binding protein
MTEPLLNMAGPLLSLQSVEVRLGRRRAGRSSGPRTILSGIDLDIAPGEIIGVIGETGSGKTTLARTVLGAIHPVAGSISFDGRDLVGLSKRELRSFRRSGALQLILQDPLRSLDPDFTVEAIVSEGLTIRGGVGASERHERVARTLRLVGLDPEIAARRPSEISGGQRQRVSIARSLIVEPRLLICDEPVSALDASTRNYLLSILADVRRELGVALLVISHDLASLAALADRIAVLFQGRIVEDGPIEEVFNRPQHPYTALLLSSAPEISRGWSTFGVSRSALRRPALQVLANEEQGCAYANRCPFADEACRTAQPPLVADTPDHRVACVHSTTWQERAASGLVGMSR